MNSHSSDLLALGFQLLVTLALALVHWTLWRQRRGAYHATWALAWSLYAARLAFISCFIVTREEGWLFAHQSATGLAALLLLWAAKQFSQGSRWRPGYLILAVLAIAWAAFAVFGIHDMAVAGISGAVLLSGVTLWTAYVFFRHWRRTGTGGALVLAVTFALWGLHHLDYPLLRSQGSSVLIGVFMDVLLIVAAALGTMYLVLGGERRALAHRNAQLEELTRKLLSAQEAERRRIARELHDEAGQVLTAVKIELDLEGRHEASARVGQVLDQIRDVSNLLRPASLDDLGLEPALRALVDDVARGTRLDVSFDFDAGGWPLPPDAQVAIYRMVQEALTNVARHSGATHATVRVAPAAGGLAVSVEDNGRGAAGPPTPHLGLLGMRERLAELGGTLDVITRPRGGFRIEAHLPIGGAA